VLRLKDGETQILGGLITDQDIQTANRVPFLGDLPVLGRLFSSQKDSKDKTELILSITPRLVRGMAPPALVPNEFWSGTENDPRLHPSSRSIRGPEVSSPDAEKTNGAVR
jgi:general secretion pathway protein D